MAADQPALFLDLDGTLLDVAARHHAVYARHVTALGGAPLPPPTYWREKRSGTAWPDLLAASGAPRDAAADFLQRFVADVELPVHLEQDTLLPGALDLLAALRPHWHLHLVTLRRRPGDAQDQVRALGLTRWFDGIGVVGAALRPGADHVAAKAEYCARHASPLGGAVVGDTVLDHHVARRCGLASVLVTTGLTDRHRLAAVRPDALLDHLHEVPAALAAIAPRPAPQAAAAVGRSIPDALPLTPGAPA